MKQQQNENNNHLIYDAINFIFNKSKYLTNRLNFESVISSLFSIAILAIFLFDVFYHEIKFPLDVWNEFTEEDTKKLETYGERDHLGILGCLTIAIGVKAFYGLRPLSFVGPIVKIFKAMIFVSIAFVIFFFVLLMIFALSFVMFLPQKFFGDVDLWQIILILFSATTANFELAKEDYGWPLELYYIVFIVVFNMILLSLFVGVLSEIYSKMVEKARSLHLEEAAQIRELYKSDEKYMFLISSYAGIDVLFSLLCLPVLPFLSDSQLMTLNSVILHIEYGIAFLLLLPLFILCEIVLLPFCYLRLLVEKIVAIKKNTNKIVNILLTIGFIFWGPVLLIGYLGCDVAHFSFECFTGIPEPCFPRNSNDYMSIHEAKDVLKKAESCSEEIVEVEEFLQQILAGSQPSGATTNILLPLLPKRSSTVLPSGTSKMHILVFFRIFIKANFTNQRNQVDRERFLSVMTCLLSYYKMSSKKHAYTKHLKCYSDKIYKSVDASDRSLLLQMSSNSIVEEELKMPKLSIKALKFYKVSKYLKGVSEFFSQNNDSLMHSFMQSQKKEQERQSALLARLEEKIDRIGAASP